MIGRRVSHYQVEEEISRGGMGIVYRAVDVRLNREVALKILPEELIRDADRKRRFIQEAQAASSLEHPHIAVIHDVDDADGVTFIAMELIRGDKLSDLIARQNLTPIRAVELMIEIASGLARAHDKHIVHRDLKPANVMITDDGHAKLIDFGIAKLIEASNAIADTVTSEGTARGVVLGTASYMSPEQTRGERVDQRSDIFSFGVMLHELLSGQRPFGGRTHADTASAILLQEAPRLSRLPAASTVAVGELQRIVDKCLAKDPADRYQGMKDLIVDLRGVRRSLETGTQTAIAAPVKSRRLWVVAALVAIILAAVGAVFLRPRPNRQTTTLPPSGKPSVAVLYFDNTTGDRGLDWLRTGIPEMVVTDLSQSSKFEVVSTERLYEIVSGLHRADDRVLSQDVVRIVAERTGVSNVVVGSYVKSGGALRINMRLQDASSGRIIASERIDGGDEATLFRMIDDLSQRIRARFESVHAVAPGTLLSKPGGTDPPLDRGLTEVTTTSIAAFRAYAEGIDLFDRARTTEAAAMFEKAVELDPTFAMAYVKLAVAHNNLNHFPERRKYAALALQHAGRVSPAQRYYIEGVSYSYAGGPGSAKNTIESYRKCVEVDPNFASCRHSLALQLTLIERYAEARQHYEELIRRGTERPVTFDNLSNVLILTGDIAGARRTMQMFVDGHPDNAEGQAALAEVDIAAGRFDDARTRLARARELGATTGEHDATRAMVEALRENWSGAEQIAKSMLVDADQATRALGTIAMARVAMFRGKTRDAINWYERALSTETTVRGASLNAARLEIVRLLSARGDYANALQRAQSATLGPVTGGATQAWLLALTGQSSAAAEIVQRIANSDPLAPDRAARNAQYARGLMATAIHDWPAAIDALELAQSTLSVHSNSEGAANSVHVAMWFALADAYRQAGQTEKAIKQFEKVASAGHERWSNPLPFVRSYYSLGTLYEQRGDNAKAREMYRRFIEYWKDGDLDRDKIADAERKLRS